MNSSARQGNTEKQPDERTWAPRLFGKRIWILATIIIGLVALAMYKRNINRDYTIEFIIPNDHRGVIVVEQGDHGSEPAVRNGDVYIYTIPDSGTLLVKNFDLFQGYHFMLARYADGRAIPTLTPGGHGPTTRNPEKISLHTVGSIASRANESARIILCVGTAEDHRRLRKQYGFE
ncbi:hypothetical protein EBZ80_24550 [bacterium]|nr:hypothetical protein [bacterium]